MRCLGLSLGVLLIVLFGCGSQEDVVPTSSIQSKGVGTILIKIVSPDHVGRLGKIVAIDRITAFVHEPDGTEITHKDLTREGDRAKATLTVQAGDNRTVVINSYEGDLIVKTGKDPDVDVAAGQTTTVEIEPHLFIPELNIEGGVTDTYIVKWEGVFLADTYSLEEDDNSDFSTPEVVYTGADTLKAFSGKEPGGSYYYRVCAMNEYGNSKWSNRRFVSVSGDGTIQIDMPWDVWDEEEGEVEGAKPVLFIVSPLAVTYEYSYVDKTATVRGEVENSGSMDAHNVVLLLTARNASGTAMDQASKTVGDVLAGDRVFFSLTFTQEAFSSEEHPISYCDYEITYDEGGPDTGNVEVR